MEEQESEIEKTRNSFIQRIREEKNELEKKKNNMEAEKEILNNEIQKIKEKIEFIDKHFIGVPENYKIKFDQILTLLILCRMQKSDLEINSPEQLQDYHDQIREHLFNSMEKELNNKVKINKDTINSAIDAKINEINTQKLTE